MLIETKLRTPVLKSGLVERPALLRHLDGVVAAKLAVISAPAGFGKSTLLGQWAGLLQERGAAVGWLSADARDNDLSRFLDYLIAAIHRADPNVAPGLPALLRSSPVLPADAILTALVNGLATRPQQLFLVIDDCHHLTAPEINKFLDAFLTYAPANLHLVMATRGQVPLKVANMRVRGQMIRLDDTQLRFSLTETECFLNGLQALDLNRADLVFLQHRTEGWIAGLQLASLSLGEKLNREDFIRRFSGTDEDIADFLIHDVLERLPAELYDFLLETAILDRFSAPLANHVTGSVNAESMIREIEDANLFLIPLDRDRAWYRYHHLFSELLRSLLLKSQPAKVAALHLKAAGWLSRHGLTTDAVQHALSAGDQDLAAGLVEACCMPLIMQSHITRVREWLNSLPAEIVARRPRLQLAQVWILFHMSKARPAAAILKSVRDTLNEREKAGSLSPRDRDEFRAELHALTAGVISAADRSATAASLATRWLSRFPEGQHFSKGTLGNVLGFCHYSLGNLDQSRIACVKARESHQQVQSVFGIVYSDLILGLVEKSAGNLRQAYDLFTRATRHARETLGAGSYAEAMVGIFEVEILYEWNDIAAAENLLQQHRQIIEECGLVVHEMTCKLHAARLAAARNRHDEALTVLEQAERQGLHSRYRRLFASALHERVKLLLSRGDVQAASLALKSRGIDEAWISSPHSKRPASEPEHMAFARLLIAEDRPEAALRILDPLAERLRKDGRLRRLAQLRAISAIAAYRAGDALTALAAIVDTVSLSAPHGALRSLLDEGAALQDVLAFGRERIPSWKTSGGHGEFIDLLTAGYASTVSRGSRQPRGAPQFSAREAEVARLLSSGQSNRDVARNLALSPDTVKWHLKNIFGKLGVANRTQAVLRLQELGLDAASRGNLPHHP